MKGIAKNRTNLHGKINAWLHVSDECLRSNMEKLRRISGPKNPTTWIAGRLPISLTLETFANIKFIFVSMENWLVWFHGNRSDSIGFKGLFIIWSSYTYIFIFRCQMPNAFLMGWKWTESMEINFNVVVFGWKFSMSICT